ncbi:uncharacterized protein LOC110097051 [Dendrobium catenatum]|uniref:Cytochrome c-552/DMSO reductase-like haem-binding domain-containing protein n=1 Tax=Dendrobium catenatum TaxID=906689 RepID=A0A2I0XH21_9ASPA|nr:uncharacterized protein LOC110097051 [Dendrobium catenatum]PKU87209.1 hypothetical protein MA16_Dca009357 [Dendrobium catenatum]
MLRLFLLSAIVLFVTIPLAAPHEGHDDVAAGSCEVSPDVRIVADYRPGIITVDGHADDWAGVEGSEFSLLPALDPDADKEYTGGKISIKAVHDGNHVFFILQIDGEYAYSQGENQKCPSVALMFQVGENASYHNMGGCKNLRGSCNNMTCRGHEVDIMHFSIGNAIPGRLYGANLVDNSEGTGGDRFGHLVDVYAWNPHCLYLDGKGPSGNSSYAQNDWQGAWWHSMITTHSALVEDDSPYSKGGEKGTYYFEFSRSLRTMDRSQQDVQFVIGQTSRVAAAFWYPTGGKPWSKSQHYSASCDWLPLDITAPSSSSSYMTSSNSSWDAATAFSLLLSVLAFCLSVFLGYWVSRSKAVPFTPIDGL